MIYLDATTRGIRCFTERDEDTFDCLKNSNESDKGCISDVNLKYSEELYDLHSDLKFRPQNLISLCGKHSNLILNLIIQTNYLNHYQNLKQYLTHSLI